MIFPIADQTVEVQGDAYLRLQSRGRTVYARQASLVARNGRLETSSGAVVLPVTMALPGFSVLPDGTVRNGQAVAGRLTLAVFEDPPAGPDDDGFFRSPRRPRLVQPEGGFTIRTVQAISLSQVQPLAQPSQTGQKASRKESEAKKAPLTIVPEVEVEVSSHVVTLGQIARLGGDDQMVKRASEIAVAKAPSVGVEVFVSRATILAKLRQAGLMADQVELNGPTTTRLRRAAQMIEHERFAQAAMAKVSEIRGGTWETAGNGPAMPAPLGNVVLTLEGLSGPPTSTSAVVAAYVDGKRINSRTVMLRSTAQVPHLKAGTQVSVRVKSGGVTLSTKGKVVSFDSSQSQATVRLVDTNATLTGTLGQDGVVEVTP